MLGIYIHIPFCKSKCGYCDFCSTTRYDEKMMEGYLKTLLSQIDEAFPIKSGISADTVYVGGGTPSVFGGKRIAKVLKHLKKHISLAENAEITVEANPESCDKSFCKYIARAGVNRVSLGVQSSNDDELKEIGRIHTFAQAKEAVENVKKYVGDNISLDLIYGLPNQSMEKWEQSVKDIMALEPMHISAYGLKLEKGSKMFDLKLDLPDDDKQADMYLKAVDMLRENGYEQYEISNFARNGRISRHNSKYWDLSEYIGFGAAAHSFYKNRRYSFKGDIEAFSKGCVEVDELEDISFGMKYRKGEYIMLMLRTKWGIDEEKYYKLFKEDFSKMAYKMEKYVKYGYALHDGMRYRLTPKGFLISNTIISDLLGSVD